MRRLNSFGGFFAIWEALMLIRMNLEEKISQPEETAQIFLTSSESRTEDSLKNSIEKIGSSCERNKNKRVEITEIKKPKLEKRRKK